MFRFHKFTPAASGWVAILPCHLMGFNFKPGFVLGKDNHGWFAASGWEYGDGEEVEFFVYRKDNGGNWRGDWEHDTPAGEMLISLDDEREIAWRADRIGISAALAAALSR